MRRLICGVLLSALILLGQPSQTNRYLALYSASLSSSTAITLTVQQPSTGANQVTFEGFATGYPAGVTVQCPGQSFTVAQAANGAAATATAGTMTPMPGTRAAAQSTFWTASNVGAGTTISPLLSFTSGLIGTLDWSTIRMGTGGTSTNVSMTITNTGTGSCTVTAGIYVREQ